MIISVIKKSHQYSAMAFIKSHIKCVCVAYIKTHKHIADIQMHTHTHTHTHTHMHAYHLQGKVDILTNGILTAFWKETHAM